MGSVYCNLSIAFKQIDSFKRVFDQGWAKSEITIKEKRKLREKPQNLWQKANKIKNFRIQATFIEYEVD